MALALRNPSAPENPQDRGPLGAAARGRAARPQLRLLVRPPIKPGSSRPGLAISNRSADDSGWRADYRALSLAELCRGIAES